MVVVNKQYKERIRHLCEIETLSRSRQQIMAVATTSPRRETNARLRSTGPLETDGFTVKSLLKNAKVFLTFHFVEIEKKTLELNFFRSMLHHPRLQHVFVIANQQLFVNFMNEVIFQLLLNMIQKEIKLPGRYLRIRQSNKNKVFIEFY